MNEDHTHDWTKEQGRHCNEYFQSAFIGSCLSIFLGGIVMILMYRAVYFSLMLLAAKLGIQMTPTGRPMFIRWKRHFQDRVLMMLSAQTSVGRVLVILVFLFSIGSLIIYFINCYSAIQFCLSFQDRTINIDLFFNIFFLFYFGLRFLAASDKLTFWVELNSIVDFFTITPVCVSFYLKKNWLGLRFLRALRLLELPKILQFLQIIKSGTSIKLSKLLAVFVSTWLTAAGFLHWIENSGDPWEGQTNLQNLGYFECLYMVMVTMSTVGYGDIVAKTTLGRCFLLFFIIGGLMLFANFIPEIADVVGSSKIYKGSYKTVKGRKFIVVCGDITLNSVTAFLRDFLSQDTGEITTEILFLGETAPNLELETVFRCYSAYATFFQGSVMKNEDLQRVQIESAEACLILADTCSAQPYIEDTANIMRVLSIKNQYANVRVIIQIIQSSNKVYLPRLPNWDWRNGDSIICFAELKLGLIAQSCLVPGLTTLLTRLFIREDNQPNHFLLGQWHEMQRIDYNILTGYLSSDFIDMTFQEVCRICFVKLNLILLAIQFKHSHYTNSILINPPSTIKIQDSTMGFFIARSAAEVKRARHYCKKCHDDIDIPDNIGKCHCRTRPAQKIHLPSENATIIQENLTPTSSPASAKRKQLSDFYYYPTVETYVFMRNPVRLAQVLTNTETFTKQDIWKEYNGMLLGVLHANDIAFGWVPPAEERQSLSEGFTSSGFSRYNIGQGTVGQQQRNWAKLAIPCRIPEPNYFTVWDTSNFAYLKKRKRKVGPVLRNHIVVCIFGDANSSLIGLRNFVMPLRASNFTFNELKDIVFVGPLEYLQREWEFIQNFPKLFILQGSALSCADLKAVNIKQCAICAVLSAHARGAGDQTLVDTTSILATLNIRSMQFKLSSSGAAKSMAAIRDPTDMESQCPFKSIPIITELKIASNAQFFEQNIKENAGGMQNQRDTCFFRGSVFSDSFLDSLLCTAYYNHHVLALLQTMVIGGYSPQLEEHLAEDISLSGSYSNLTQFAPKNRCKLALLPLTDNPASLDGLLIYFADVYCKALDMFGIICFGLYRVEEEEPAENRFVISRPANNLEIFASDLFFCFVPFNTSATDLTDVIANIKPKKRKNAWSTGKPLFL